MTNHTEKPQDEAEKGAIDILEKVTWRKWGSTFYNFAERSSSAESFVSMVKPQIIEAILEYHAQRLSCEVPVVSEIEDVFNKDGMSNDSLAIRFAPDNEDESFICQAQLEAAKWMRDLLRARLLPVIAKMREENGALQRFRIEDAMSHLNEANQLREDNKQLREALQEFVHLETGNVSLLKYTPRERLAKAQQALTNGK